MSVSLKERGLVGSIAHALTEASRWVKRGYTNAQWETATRILTGNINPDDREKFIREEKQRLAAVFIPDGSIYRDPDQIPLHLPATIEEYKEEISALESLSNEEIDQRLKERTRQKREAWIGIVQR